MNITIGKWSDIDIQKMITNKPGILQINIAPYV